MKVNGKEIYLETITTVSELLGKLNLNEEKVVVWVNGENICIERYSKHSLDEKDEIEIISIISGG
ncbi:sulfur carrier protein ThiS [Paramaledivibacter caminithermalis]|uniref:ThiS family protein n=1 Tax=Paramaledivibacter caminithermalis (strain DSM 15212 / CIP 107654 / DViRD3) TaxID=1121301 RepID=A0A1M6SPX2_PARC5|nr:sulfur carrier protein ThiS [Paramaledivibacter caminithermalis]SHK46677.1 ThiS family protein [Paramaledivibacter caminithermalis DSM 15212]